MFMFMCGLVAAIARMKQQRKSSLCIISNIVIQGVGVCGSFTGVVSLGGVQG